MRTGVWGLPLCVVALSVSSCAISSERDDERAVAWARAYLDAQCRYHVRCEAQFGRFAAREQAVCHPDGWASVVFERAARVGSTFAFDDERAARCLAAIERASCRVPYGAPYDADLLECNRALTGVLPTGSACDPTDVAGGCADRGRCVAAEGTCGGVCSGPAQRGESCAVRPCADGTQCWPDDAGRTCLGVDLEPGAACTEVEHCRAVDDHPYRCTEGRCAPVPTVALGDACADGATLCPDGAACVEGTCTVRLGEGAPCRARVECQEGLICDAAAPEGRCSADTSACGVCPAESPHCVHLGDEEPRCSADPTGEPCQGTWYSASTFYAPDSCPDTHRCDVAPAGGHVCLPIVAVGSACDGDHLCEDGSRCAGGRCTALVGPGDACGATAACPRTHACVDGACAPLPSLGEACSGACFEGGCVEGRCELLAEGEPCDTVLDGSVPQCRDLCVSGVCTGERASAGEACGLRVAQCEHDLRCIARPDDTGVCAASCSE